MILSKIRAAKESLSHSKDLLVPAAFTPAYALLGYLSPPIMYKVAELLSTNPELKTPLELLTFGLIGASFIYTSRMLAKYNTCIDANSVIAKKILEKGPRRIVENKFVRQALPYIAVGVAALVDVFNPADPTTDALHAANFFGQLPAGFIGKYMITGTFNLASNMLVDKYGEKSVDLMHRIYSMTNVGQRFSPLRQLLGRRFPQSGEVPPVIPSAGVSGPPTRE